MIIKPRRTSMGIKGLTKSWIICPICGRKDNRLEPLIVKDTWYCHTCGIDFVVVYDDVLREVEGLLKEAQDE